MLVHLFVVCFVPFSKISVDADNTLEHVVEGTDISFKMSLEGAVCSCKRLRP